MRAFNTRSALQVAWSDRDLFRWLLEREKPVGYLGWLNRGNLGDELMYQLHRKLLGSHGVRPLAIHYPGCRLQQLAKSSVETVLVGGGTLLLSDAWAVRLENIMSSISYKRLVVFGAGAHDLDDAMRRKILTASGAQLWSDLLTEASFVGVRGPYSARSLAEIGIESQVVGDPAVGVSIDCSARRKESTVAINLTDVRDASSAALQLRPRIARLVTELVESGYQCTVFSMDRGDADATMLYLRDAGLDVRGIKVVATLDSTIHTIATSTLVFTERLHGAVISANLGTPFIPIAYKPKSLDFLASIDSEYLALDRGDAEVGAARDLVNELLAGSNRWARTLTKVARLQESFQSVYNKTITPEPQGWA